MNFTNKLQPALTRLFPVLLLISALQIPALSQDDKKEDVASPETPKEKQLEKKMAKQEYSFRQFGHETSLFIKQPTKWKGRDYLRLGIVVATTAAVMPFDQQINNSTLGYQRYYHSAPTEGGRIYGEWYTIVGVAGTFGLYGIIAHDTASKKISIELLQAGLYSELVTTVLKVAIGRARPNGTVEAYTFKPFTFFDYDYHSMPSGHTTSAFALSTVMSRHAHTTFLKILAYVPAGLTMFSRIYQHQHWLSDEILGAAIGTAVGYWVVDLHEGKKHKINVTSVYPIGISYSLSGSRSTGLHRKF